MRIAVVSDVHGNLTALEAVVADLRATSPDLVLHGGDLAASGARPVEVVDRIRELGWAGVLGNTDEMLFRPESLTEFASGKPNLAGLFATIGELAAATREALGEERLGWLRDLPWTQAWEGMALVHASPKSFWHAPMPEASDAELEETYAGLRQPVAVYAHIHRAYVRRVGGMVVANTGSVSLSHDGDCRAAYLLVDAPGTAECEVTVRRVAYDVPGEMRALGECGYPHADWVARQLAGARPLMP
jgi:putative phosphoesterase